MGTVEENVCARNIIDIFDYTAGIMHFNAPTLHSRVCLSLTHKITIMINLLLKFFNLEHIIMRDQIYLGAVWILEIEFILIIII